MSMNVYCLAAVCIVFFGIADAGDPCGSYGWSIDVTRPGVITSPDYDLGKYPSSQDCHWTIKAKVNHFVRLKFTDLDIENDQSCIRDYVTFYRNSIEGTRRFCGPRVPPVLIYDMEESLYISFRSNSLIEGRGFRLEYSLDDSNETCSNEELRCHNSKCVPLQTKCDGVDHCGDGTDEEECDYRTKFPSVCGTQKFQPIEENGDRIVGGTEVIPGSWPWQISIQEKHIFPSGHFCGGSLINNFWILTAAHCLISRKAEKVHIKLGSHGQFKSQKEEITRYATRVFIHEKYNTTSDENDIALVKLNAPVFFTDYIKPVCLPKNGTDIPEDSQALVTGWGKIGETSTAEILQQITLPVILIKECKELFPYFQLFETNICTTNRQEGQNPCQGDSGGPLMLKDGSTWTVNGLVSWGWRDCTAKKPSVYTKVSAYVNWINAKINKWL